jgi:voltage-gated potassium channel Kch
MKEGGRLRSFGWRALLPIATVVLGLVGFASGVGVSQRADIADAGIAAQLYYTLGLFIFGGMDLGTPEGGAFVPRMCLWIAYFAAPAITASAVIETALRLVGVDRLGLRRIEGHIVIAGCSRLTTLYLQRLRVHHPEQPVIVVAGPNEAAPLSDLRELYRAQVIEGDITSEAILRRLRLPFAARVLLLTDDDFTNLDAATRIMDIAPTAAQHVVAHVGDLRFMRSMSATQLARACQVFNGHQIAAAHLVQAHLLEHFRRTSHTDVVVLAGFGRFGQTVLDELQRGAEGAFDRVVIVDLEATSRARIFDEQVGFASGYARELVDGDIRDPSVWERIEQTVELAAIEPVFVVGSGIDETNLRIALRLASRYPSGFIIARSDRKWSFAEAFSREAGIRTVSVAELVAESMPDAWFGPRKAVAELPEPLLPTR